MHFTQRSKISTKPSPLKNGSKSSFPPILIVVLTNPTFRKVLPNPLPFVNKALALYQWKRDFSAASALCREALEIDDECDAAIAMLAQLSLQEGHLEEAIKMFGKHAAIARSEEELVKAVMYENVSPRVESNTARYLNRINVFVY